jgi:hypothetical protein
MTSGDTSDPMNQFPIAQAVDQHGVVVLGSDEQSIAFQINAEVIKVPFYIGGKSPVLYLF